MSFTFPGVPVQTAIPIIPALPSLRSFMSIPAHPPLPGGTSLYGSSIQNLLVFLCPLYAFASLLLGLESRTCGLDYNDDPQLCTNVIEKTGIK